MANKSKILIVEDHEYVALMLRARLRPLVDRVEIVCSWAEAVSKIALNGFTVALVDLDLTDSNRPRTLAHLQDLLAYNPALKIVVMSALPLTNAEIQEAFDRGACKCITKTEQYFHEIVTELADPPKTRGFTMLSLLAAFHI